MISGSDIDVNNTCNNNRLISDWTRLSDQSQVARPQSHISHTPDQAQTGISKLSARHNLSHSLIHTLNLETTFLSTIVRVHHLMINTHCVQFTMI